MVPWKYTINMKAVWGQKENSEVLFVLEWPIRTVNAGCIKYKITWSPKDDRMEELENIQPRTEAAATCAYLLATTTANPSRFCWIYESIFWTVQTMIIAIRGPMVSFHRLGTFKSLITWGFKLHLQKSWAVKKKSINHIVKSIPSPPPPQLKTFQQVGYSTMYTMYNDISSPTTDNLAGQKKTANPLCRDQNLGLQLQCIVAY